MPILLPSNGVKQKKIVCVVLPAELAVVGKASIIEGNAI